MGGGALSLPLPLTGVRYTGLATSAAGRPSAPIVSQAHHGPARMAGLTKAVFPFYSPTSHSLFVCVCGVGAE